LNQQRIAIIAGPRRDFLSMIRAEFEKIHQTLPGLKPEIETYIVLPDNLSKPVSYSYLLELESDGIEIFRPEGLRQDLNVKQLLNGYESPNSRDLGHKSEVKRIKPPSSSDLDPTIENTKALHRNTSWVIIGTIVTLFTLLSGLGIFKFLQANPDPQSSPSPNSSTKP
jgi:hypothetical protein